MRSDTWAKPVNPGTSMFEDRSLKRTFSSAPQSVTSFIAAVLEPSITVLALIVATLAFDDPLDRPTLTACLLVFALSFPGLNRFRENSLAAAVDIVTSWAMLALILLLCGYATSSLRYFDNRVLASWAVATPVLQWLSVRLGSAVQRRQAAGARESRAAVVVGAGSLGVKVAKALSLSELHGIDFMGYFDDRSDGRLHAEATSRRLGGLNDLAAYISAHGVREVYITLPLGSQPRIIKLLEQLQGTTASLYFVPDVFGISIIQGHLLDVNGIPVVAICETPFTGTNELIKRLSDILLSTLILLLIAPLLLIIALGVRFTSPGPIIFTQRRNGLDGDEILVYKFRSMTAQDDGDSIPQATRRDPRVTRFGAFLRKYSLDELPQFINVLQGRMSIVGPRPHAVAHNEQYRQLIKAYMVRHKVRPGITGWAQINGMRGGTDTVEKMQARLEYDLEYLRNWSLRLDLQIIVRTIRLVIADPHAY